MRKPKPAARAPGMRVRAVSKVVGGCGAGHGRPHGQHVAAATRSRGSLEPSTSLSGYSVPRDAAQQQHNSELARREVEKMTKIEAPSRTICLVLVHAIIHARFECWHISRTGTRASVCPCALWLRCVFASAAAAVPQILERTPRPLTSQQPHANCLSTQPDPIPPHRSAASRAAPTRQCARQSRGLACPCVRTHA